MKHIKYAATYILLTLITKPMTGQELITLNNAFDSAIQHSITNKIAKTQFDSAFAQKQLVVKALLPFLSIDASPVLTYGLTPSPYATGSTYTSGSVTNGYFSNILQSWQYPISVISMNLRQALPADGALSFQMANQTFMDLSTLNNPLFLFEPYATIAWSQPLLPFWKYDRLFWNSSVTSSELQLQRASLQLSENFNTLKVKVINSYYEVNKLLRDKVYEQTKFQYEEDKLSAFRQLEISGQENISTIWKTEGEIETTRETAFNTEISLQDAEIGSFK